MGSNDRPALAFRSLRNTLLLAYVLPTWAAPVGDERPPAPPALPEVVVTIVLPETGTTLDEVASNVQVIDARSLEHGGGNLAATLNQAVGSVTVNDTQGNPYQPDVAFRGFTASPVLGTPQGVSVFVDGVRVNEAFADVVNWDLIPEIAIADIVLVPGSNPVFGLNSLGGALTVTTKRGFSFQGTAANAALGSFNGRSVDVETGGHGERLDYYLAGNAFDDNGWAAHNPSAIRQLFGKVGFRGGAIDAALSATFADNTLEGNQTLPLSFLSNPSQAYTWPDRQTNRLFLVNANASLELEDSWQLAAGGFWRDVRTAVVNSNVNNDYDPSLPIGAGNQPTGNALEDVRQQQSGATLQVTSRSPFGAHANVFVAGANYDRGDTDFRQSDQEAGSSRDTTSSAPTMLVTALHATNEYSSIYVTDTFGFDAHLHVNVTARYDSASVTLEDQLGTALNGHHSFGRLDPALGFTLEPGARIILYASFGETMRAPTPVELTCADPHAPCMLPNAFAADPPLRPVVARTIEVGARSSAAQALSWSAALFRTRLSNDIQFVSSGGGAVNSGYFQNVGETRHAGIELGGSARRGPLLLSARYAYVAATYRTPLVLNSPNNSTAGPISCAQCTEIQVVPGDRVPGVPNHAVKVRAEVVESHWVLGAGVVAQSDQFARGDENNRDRNGAVPGFAVLNLDVSYAIAPRWQVFARIDNALDRRYSTFGVLGRNVFTAPADSFDPSGETWRSEQFRSVGAPRSVWVGIALRAGSKGQSAR